MPPVLFQMQGPVAVVTLNRPEKLNSFNREMALLLQDLLHQCADEQVRAVYITGAGKGFCAGQDLEEVLDTNGPGMEKILKEHFNPVIELIRSLPKPVLAAVNGVAAGAGANIALCCDVVVASASASFIQAFSKIGLIPDSGGTYTLPRLVGWQRASALMMLGNKVTADEALKMGMVYQVLPAGTFEQDSQQLAQQLANMPTHALALIKQALNQSAGNTLTQQLALEDRLQQEAAATADFREGVEAFVQKRSPNFTGK